jgi:iron complex outermembrane receptor protein
MKIKQKPIASAVTLALLGAAITAHAQQAPKAQQLDTITVTGIRGSLEKSLETKRNADGVTEVITSEDIGKMPDKNIADAVSRVPGVTMSSQSGGSGGFDENDRVSMRGTNPSLTQTLINGHAVASGDWFVLDQVGLVGRSVSFSLLPSELVSQVIVRKSATADLVEGGVAGAVDIITRKPLQFSRQVTLEGSLGGVYAELPKKTDPQLNALINWKNSAGTLGILGQAFSEKRHLRRDGQETLGYANISPTSALATARPDLANVAYPTLIGSSLFEQERERKGGLIDVQLRPTNNFEIDLNAFRSHMDATNYNRNWMFWGTKVIGNDNRIPTSYTVRNGTLVAADFPNVGMPGANAQYAVVDNIYREAFSETSYANLDAKWVVADRLTITGQVGSTTGKGETPTQGVFEGDVFNTGASYSMNGLNSPVNVAFPSGNPAVFTGTALDWIFGASPAKTKDKEKYARADGEWSFDRGVVQSVKFGGRWAEHTRNTVQVAQGPNFALDPFAAANLPAWNGETYPGNFGEHLGGGNFPRNVWQLDPGVLRAWGDTYSNRDPLGRQFWSGEFAIKEKVSAGYVMASFDGQGWSGNVGARMVRTDENVTVNVAIPGSECGALQPCPQVPGAITTSAFGSFYQTVVRHGYNDFLPSGNLKLDIGDNKLVRFAMAKTLSRPDYSALGGAITADDTTLTGNGGNPDLKPIRSTNFDVAFEWYYQPRALLQVGLFHMNLSNYVAFGTYQTELLNIRDNAFRNYTISAPVNSKGSITGLETAWQQPLGYGFGFQANYTYADAQEDRNCAPAATDPCIKDLVGASKSTYNLSAYYEDHGFSARIAYNYRSKFFVGLDRSSPQYQDDTGVLSASLSYTINRNFALFFDALNLNRPILKYYGANTDQPRAFYDNGRQFYFGVRVKL